MNPDDIVNPYNINAKDIYPDFMSTVDIKKKYYNSTYGAGMSTDAMRPLGRGLDGLSGELMATQSFRKLIKEKKIRLPYDMKYDDLILNSKAEPDFLDNLREEYPEYFI